MNDFEIVETRDFRPNQKKGADDKKEELYYSEFAMLWMRYLVSENLLKTMEKCYKESPLQNLLNIRPTIINNRNSQDSISGILNPRLKSSEVLKKIHNMNRILENVTTYYFEKLLTVP